MGCLRAFSCLEQSFPEGIIKPYKGTSLSILLAKSAASNILSHFLSFGYMGERLHGPGLETERLDIASFVVGSKKSLTSQ